MKIGLAVAAGFAIFANSAAAQAQSGVYRSPVQQAAPTNASTFAPPVHIHPENRPSSSDRMARFANSMQQAQRRSGSPQTVEDAELQSERIETSSHRPRNQPAPNYISEFKRHQRTQAQPPRRTGPDLQQRITNLLTSPKYARKLPTKAETRDAVIEQANFDGPTIAEPAQRPVVRQSVLARPVQQQEFEPSNGTRLRQVESVAYSRQVSTGTELEIANADQEYSDSFAGEQAIEIVAPNSNQQDFDHVHEAPERQAMLDEFGRPISVLEGSQDQPPMHSAVYRNQLRRQDVEPGLQPTGASPIQELQQQDDEMLNELPERSPLREQADVLGAGPLDKSCDDFRKELFANPLRDISLDISPPKKSSDNEMGLISRTWTDRYGQPLGTGTMVDMRRGYVIIQGDRGLQKISYSRLGDSDLAAVADYWQIPAQCIVGHERFPGRYWAAQTVTWTASGLCHKPLYFENIQLERYGHSHGPISQPIQSTVHFFASMFTLPYQSAMHPPTECQYALGFYRPGNCAPWLKNPVPISLSGIRRQALAVTGLSFLP